MSSSGKLGLVSVVVASYNHAEYLEQRMDSLINQTYQDIEILVIDDCSTDNSLEVLRRYESHPKVRLIVREQNGGWVAVSNQGVENSSGEYVIFANCDDACDPLMIERLVDAMKSNPSAGIAFCRSFLVDKDDYVLGDDLNIQESSFRTRCARNTLISGDEMGRFLLHSCVIPNLSAALFRTECFIVVGDLSAEYRACSDWDLFFRVASKYDIVYVTEPLNRFRQHDTTIRNTMKGRATFEEYFRVMLGNMKMLDLTMTERARTRMRVMSLWAVHIVSPSTSGLSNFPYHFRRVFELDPYALLFLVPNLFFRSFIVFGKALSYGARSLRHKE
jgi:glycosyltransferase involved in cell wall biosynthesis